MTQLSAPVFRAISVLDFLSGHVEQAFTLTEIAKSLQMSSATCHNIVSSLVETGYVYRTAGKTYVLGPAIARIARASLSPALIMLVARPEMRLLADEFDVVCSAYYAKQNEVWIYERASAASHLNWNTPQTLNVPIRAPIGGIFYAWENASAIDHWLDTAQPPLAQEQRTKLLDSLNFLRERGFTFGTRKESLSDAAKAKALQNQQALTEYTLSALDPQQNYQLAFVTAPVFSHPGKIAFGLSLAGFVKPIQGAQIEQMGERLLAACDRIGSFIAGRALP